MTLLLPLFICTILVAFSGRVTHLFAIFCHLCRHHRRHRPYACMLSAHRHNTHAAHAVHMRYCHICTISSRKKTAKQEEQANQHITACTRAICATRSHRQSIRHYVCITICIVCFSASNKTKKQRKLLTNTPCRCIIQSTTERSTCNEHYRQEHRQALQGGGMPMDDQQQRRTVYGLGDRPLGRHCRGCIA